MTHFTSIYPVQTFNAIRYQCYVMRYNTLKYYVILYFSMQYATCLAVGVRVSGCTIAHPVRVRHFRRTACASVVTRGSVANRYILRKKRDTW